MGTQPLDYDVGNGVARGNGGGIPNSSFYDFDTCSEQPLISGADDRNGHRARTDHYRFAVE